MLSPNGCNNMTFVVFRVLYLFSRYGSMDEGRLAIGEMGGFSCRRSKKISSWSYYRGTHGVHAAQKGDLGAGDLPYSLSPCNLQDS
jgi:hypothetical protein